MSFEKNLDKYANLAVKVGVNIQEGQTLLVRSPIECAPFVRKVVKQEIKRLSILEYIKDMFIKR